MNEEYEQVAHDTRKQPYNPVDSTRCDEIDHGRRCALDEGHIGDHIFVDYTSEESHLRSTHKWIQRPGYRVTVVGFSKLPGADFMLVQDMNTDAPTARVAVLAALKMKRNDEKRSYMGLRWYVADCGRSDLYAGSSDAAAANYKRMHEEHKALMSE